MNQEAIMALLEMGEYSGPDDVFLRESATRIQAALHCSIQESEHTLQDLRDSKAIDFRMTRGGELPLGNVPFASWYWFAPQES
jgi:hypothetical protein